MRLQRFVGIVIIIACSFGLASAQNASISLDYVVGLAGTDSITTGAPVRFYLRLTNNTSDTIAGMTNGFRVYSPDGAQWNTTVGDTTGTVGLAQFDAVFVINSFSVTGSGEDTLGFGGAKWYGPGLVPGFDQVAYTVTIGPIDSVYAGRTICLDSSFFPPAGYWLWSTAAATDVVPSWDGPHCFTVVYKSVQPDTSGFTLDHVDGLAGTDSIGTGIPVRFYLRLSNYTGDSIAGLTNGFRVYSPDGAQWNTTVGDTIGTIGQTQFDLFFWIDHNSVTGSGADTVGFSGARMYGPGVAPGFDQVAYTVTIGPIDSVYAGRTICLDSSYYQPPNGYWLWATSSGGGVIPSWDGPHCFTVVPTAPPPVADSLIVPSVVLPPCGAVQPVVAKISQPIKGAAVPLKIPVGVTIDSLSFAGLPTANWDYTFKQIKPDSGFLLVAVANSFGYVIPPGTTTIFTIHFRADAGCQTSSYITWDTALSSDPSRHLLYADTNNLDLEASFDRDRDVTEILGYLPGDIDGNDDVNVVDLTALVAYLFQGGLPPCVFNAADLNGTCSGPNIADLTYLVDYLFQGGVAPQCGCLRSGVAKGACKISTDILAEARFEKGFTTITLSSSVALRGLQFELAGPAGAQPVNLLGKKFDLAYGNAGLGLRVGLLDLEGEAIIQPGTHRVIQLDGKYELIEVIVSDEHHHDLAAMIESAGIQINLPENYALRQNYPNPFNPSTEISFSLPEASKVSLEVFNVMGQKVATLIDGTLGAGDHIVQWSGRDSWGKEVASGVYFYKLRAGDFEETRKMLLLK